MAFGLRRSLKRLLGKMLILLPIFVLGFVGGCGKVDVQENQTPTSSTATSTNTSDTSAPPAVAGKFVLYGTVYEGSGGAAVSGATVTANSDPVTTTTNSNGYYEVVVDPGSHTLTVSKSSYDTVTEQFTASSGGVLRNRIAIYKTGTSSTGGGNGGRGTDCTALLDEGCASGVPCDRCRDAACNPVATAVCDGRYVPSCRPKGCPGSKVE